MRRLLLAILVVAPALIPGMAMAAPGDPLPGNPPLTIPAQPDALYPVISRCYDLAPAGSLPRRACYQFVSATGEIIRDADGDPDGQTFIYPPENTMTAPVIPDTPARAPYSPPPLSPAIPQVPAQAAPGPIAPLPHATPVAETLADTPDVTANGDPMASRDDPLGCVADAVRGMPGFDPNLDPDGDGVSCESPPSNLPRAEDAADKDSIGGILLWVAIGLAVVALAIGFLPKRNARHAAE